MILLFSLDWQVPSTYWTFNNSVVSTLLPFKKSLFFIKKLKKKCFFFTIPTVYKSSWAKDRTHATAITRATPVMIPGPQPTEP